MTIPLPLSVIKTQELNSRQYLDALFLYSSKIHCVMASFGELIPFNVKLYSEEHSNDGLDPLTTLVSCLKKKDDVDLEKLLLDWIIAIKIKEERVPKASTAPKKTPHRSFKKG